jgi:hypothetical protein
MPGKGRMDSGGKTASPRGLGRWSAALPSQSVPLVNRAEIAVPEWFIANALGG